MGKINRAVGMLAAVAGAAAWSQPGIAGGDLWIHLAAGRETLSLGGPPAVDHFSFTFAGKPWMNHEWLWGTVAWWLYRLSPDAVAFANLAVIAATFAVWLTIARRHTGSAAAACLALWAAAATSYWFLDVRPHEVTMLFVGVVVATRERRWARWMWAPLMVIWCNVHGGFAFGLGTIGLFALVHTAETSRAERRLRIDWTLWLGVGLAGLAFLCNPWGWRILEYPLAFLNSRSPFRDVVEWLPPKFDLDLRNYSGRFFWLLGVAAAGAALELFARLRGDRQRGDVYLVLLPAVAAFMALTSRRFIPLFALTAMPIVARLLAAIIAEAGQRLPDAARLRTASVFPALALGAALLLWRDVRIFPHLLARWNGDWTYPTAALRYAEALKAGPRLISDYTWGGYIMFHARDLKVLIDGRANVLYSDEAYNDYVLMMSSPGGFHARLRTYAPDLALVQAGPLAIGLTAAQYGWVQAYADDVAVVLLPPGSPRLRSPLPNPDEVVGDEPQWQIARASALNVQDQTDAAREMAEAAIARDPLQVPAYGALAISYARDRDVGGIAASIARGLAVEPRFAEPLHQFEARAYMAAEAPELALAAIMRGLPRGPFLQPGAADREVARLKAFIASRTPQGLP